jgi:hypothetical protein
MVAFFLEQNICPSSLEAENEGLQNTYFHNVPLQA